MKEFETKIVEAHLQKMKLNSTEDVNEWYRRSKSGEYTILGLKKAAKTILKYRDKNVYIFGDYDVDGTIATAILFLTLKAIGFKSVKFRIPYRFTEGFGMNEKMLDEIKEAPEDVIIITVDNGISAIDVVKKAKEIGYTVVVTDHHQPVIADNKVVIPDADIVIDPNAITNSSAFDGYCGAGIAYKLSAELLNEELVKTIYPEEGKNIVKQLTDFSRKLLPLAALATVCDQMELKEENYVFVREGLKLLNHGIALPGMLILGETLGISVWTEDKFGFNVGPCINALERMENGASQYAVALMASSNRDRCISITEFMRKCNEKRKAAVEYGYQKVIDIISARGDSPGYPIIEYIPRAGDKELEKLEGYIGNIVGKITEQYQRPCALFTDSTEEVLKGSFRSVEGYDIKSRLDTCQDMFVKYGGHAMAAGASVRKDLFDEMRKKMQDKSMQHAAPKEESLKKTFDVAIKDSDISEAINIDQRFAPFGNANEPLIFKIDGFRVIYDRDEIKHQIKGNGVRLKSIYSTAVGFGMWDLTKGITGPCELTLYGKISYNHFNGVSTPQVELIDIEIANPTKQKVTKLQQMLAEASIAKTK